MPIPVIIITGFLGGGKTTFLRHLLPVCGTLGVRPALIINEVGAVDVDGELLADLHAEQVKLVGGCVCCTLQAGLKDTLFDVLDAGRYDAILIECSGLSNPVDILNLLTIPALLTRVTAAHVVCLVNAKRLPTVVRAVELAKHQLAAADLVLLNKADQVPDGLHDELYRLATALAPHAARHWTTYADPGIDVLRGLLVDAGARHAVHAATGDHAHGHAHTHDLPASFCTLALALPDGLTTGAVRVALQALPDNVIRAKGFAHLADGGWHVLHKVDDVIDLSPHTGAPPSRGAVLVCIGPHLDRQAIVTALGLPVAAGG